MPAAKASKYSFTGILKDAGEGGGAYVEVPFDVEQEFGSKRPRIKAVIEGISYRGSLVRMGTGCHILGVLKSVREQAGKRIGDTIQVSVELDTAPRQVDVPEDLAQALREDATAGASFESLSYSHQREYVSHILEARRPETRSRRVGKVVEMLKQTKKGH